MQLCSTIMALLGLVTVDVSHKINGGSSLASMQVEEVPAEARLIVLHRGHLQPYTA